MPDLPMSSSDDRTAKLWQAELFEDTMKKAFFTQRFMSKNQDNMIYVEDSLESKKGDRVRIGLDLRLNRGFLASGTKVNTNEYKGKTVIDDIEVLDKNFGVVSDDPLSEQRAFYNMIAADRKRLINNGAEALDQEFFTALDATNTTTMYLDGGVVKATSTIATATGGVEASDKMNPELLTQLKAAAQTGFNRRQTPIAPIVINGDYYWVLLTHPDALADLENDTTFLAGQREAMERGKTNPLFKGAKTVWRNVIIYAHENISIGTSGSVSYVKSHLLGANALGIAWAKKVVIEKKKPAYNNEEHGWGWFSIFGVKKLQFDSNNDGTKKDFGAITVVTSRTQISDITIS